MAGDTGDLRAMRPEIIGGTLALKADGTFFQTIYFTDEESARKGEQPQRTADDLGISRCACAAVRQIAAPPIIPRDSQRRARRFDEHPRDVRDLDGELPACQPGA